MPSQVRLPLEELSQDYRSFLSIWEVSDQPLYVPPSEAGDAVFVWPGSFINGRTIAIVGREIDCRDLLDDPLYVGKVVDLEPSTDNDRLEQYIYSADQAVLGIHAAVLALNERLGLPSGHRVPIGRFATVRRR